MTEERLEKLNKLKEEIKNCEVALRAIESCMGWNIELSNPSYVVPDVPVPDELKNVLLTLLEDYYTRKLNELKEEFKEG